MLLFEAAQEFKGRLELDLREQIPEYFEAMEIAVKCIEAQERLAELLNDFYSEDEEKHKNDTYSRALVLELLESVCFRCEEQEDGQD